MDNRKCTFTVQAKDKGMDKKCKVRTDKDLCDNHAVRLVSKQQSKPLPLAVLNKLNSLKTLLKQQDGKCWEIGDLCIELIDEHRLSLRHIGEFTDYSRTRISHFHLTSRTFTTNQRKGYTFQDSLTARQIHRKLPRLDMSPADIRDVIIKLRNKTPTQVRAHFVNILTEQEQNQHLAQSAQSYIYKDRLINTCHHIDWREIVPKLPDGSVQLFIADPPFATSSGYISKRAETNALRIDCDHGTTEEQALEVTLPLFDLCMPKLAPDGVLLLFQGGGKSDRIEVLQKAQECGWDCLYALTWDKGHLSVGNFQNPYLISTERILIFARKNNKLGKYQDGLPHSDILSFPTETQHATRRMHSGKLEYGDYHMFQKPPALMEFLIQHHSFPGDLVVEPFGCSGSGVIAASKLSRQWVYIESNEKNYSWGSQRVMKAVSEQSVRAG
jgi:DNA modification methylase